MQPLPGGIAWQVAKQCQEGLNYMHRNGVIHGDLHSHSVLFAISDISRLSDEQIIQEIGQPDGSRVVRHDRKGPAGPEAPMFQFWDKRLPWGEMRRNPQIRIIDFGEALQGETKEIPSKTPVYRRAPEILFKEPWGNKAEIWSFACFISEINCEGSLFEAETRGEAIQAIENTLGLLPARWRDNWKRPKRSRELDPEDEEDRKSLQRLALNLKDLTAKTYFEDDPELSLENDCLLPRHKVEQPGDMLTSILVYDPQDRPSAAQLLDHPFFADNPCEHDDLSGWTK